MMRLPCCELRICCVVAGAWAYSMVYPDGTVRDGAQDILNLMTLSYNPNVSMTEPFTSISVDIVNQCIDAPVCGLFDAFALAHVDWMLSGVVDAIRGLHVGHHHVDLRNSCRRCHG